MLLALDADTVLTPYIEVIAAAGFKVVFRYLKNLLPSEGGALHAAGLAIGLIYERGSQDVLGGAVSGDRDGRDALSRAIALGAPVDRSVAIYATADADIGEDQIDTAIAYWAAFDAIVFEHFKIGGYADGTLLSSLRSDNMDYTWLAGAMGWDGSREFAASGNPTVIQGPTIEDADQWPRPLLIPNVEPVMWPNLGFPYDPDLVMVEDAGLWLPPPG